MRFRTGAQVRRLPLGIVISFVVGCAPVPEAARHDVGYYRTHAEERESALAACAADPGTVGNTPDCINVREATRQEGIGSLQTLPPMQLPLTSPKPEQQ